MTTSGSCSDRVTSIRRKTNAALVPPTAECCVQPPAVLEFDTEGKPSQVLGRPRIRAGVAEFGTHHLCRQRKHRLVNFKRVSPAPAPPNPHVVFFVDKDGVFRTRPPRRVSWAAPGLEKAALGIEFKHRRRLDAAFGGRCTSAA